MSRLSLARHCPQWPFPIPPKGEGLETFLTVAFFGAFGGQKRQGDTGSLAVLRGGVFGGQGSWQAI